MENDEGADEERVLGQLSGRGAGAGPYGSNGTSGRTGGQELL